MFKERLAAIERLALQDTCMFAGGVRCEYCTRREACPKFRKSIEEYLTREDDDGQVPILEA
jgi:hypothetical protein